MFLQCLLISLKPLLYSYIMYDILQHLFISAPLQGAVLGVDARGMILFLLFLCLLACLLMSVLPGPFSPSPPPPPPPIDLPAVYSFVRTHLRVASSLIVLVFSLLG